MMGMAQEKMSEENLAEKEIIVNEELRPANLNADAGRKQPESGFQKTLVKNEITYFQSESSGGVLFGVKKSAAKILIVDDVASIVMTVRKFLEHHGYNVITANDGKEGLEKARAEQPDLIILDLMLPKMDG